MQPHERERLHYAPHLQFIKELVFSEGEPSPEFPDSLEQALIDPPTVLATRLERSGEQLDQMMEDLRHKIQHHPGYELYLRRVSATATESLPPAQEVADLEAEYPLYTLLYRSLYFLRHDLDSWLELARQAQEEIGDTDQERDYFLEWVRDEVRQQKVAAEIQALAPLVPVNNPDPQMYDRYMRLKDELQRLRRSNYLRRSDPLLQSLAPVARQAEFIERLRPRALQLIHGALQNDIKGDPVPLLTTLLDAALSPAGSNIRTLRRHISALITALNTARNIHRLIAARSMSWASLLFLTPAKNALQKAFSQTRQFRREIFDPLSGILDLLMEVDDRSGQLETFASSALEVMERIDRFFRETNREISRFELANRKNIEDSFDRLEDLRRIEGYLAMLEAALREIDRVPRFIEDPSERRRVVQRLATEQGWHQRYDPHTHTMIAEGASQEESLT